MITSNNLLQMNTPIWSYRPLVPSRENPRRHALHDGSGCPHTSGVRLAPCGSFATNTCRPTACARITAEPAPNVHCSLYIVHCWFYTFSAKEKDVETGLSYFGSRYYSSDLSIWLSVDPMSDKYASLSPYVYCADNPVKLVDPNGEEVWIFGDDVIGAVAQLQNQTNLKLYISKDGKLTYSGKVENSIDELIANAIDDEDISVNMIANRSNSFGDIYTEYGGGFMGNTYEDGKVCTDQFVCTSLLAKYDKSVGDTRAGLTMVHELAESYYGGQIALQNQKSSPVAGSEGSTYNEAHSMANKIAAGDRGPVYWKLPMIGVEYLNNNHDDFINRRNENNNLDFNHIYIRIGWKRLSKTN